LADVAQVQDAKVLVIDGAARTLAAKASATMAVTAGDQRPVG